ncbi:MAG: hypothetical protein Q8R35_02480 [bacterium]|nr:hypothetical protein [bacterium]
MAAWQIAVIIAVGWLLVGVAAVGLAVECSPKLRREVILQSRRQRERRVVAEMRRHRLTRAQAEKRFRLDSERYHLNIVYLVFAPIWPLAILVLMFFVKRSKAERG